MGSLGLCPEIRKPPLPSTSEPCFFAASGLYIFSWLRFAKGLPTPLQCQPTPGSCVLICLHVPTLITEFSILPERPAFGAFVGSAWFCVLSCHFWVVALDIAMDARGRGVQDMIALRHSPNSGMVETSNRIAL